MKTVKVKHMLSIVYGDATVKLDGNHNAVQPLQKRNSYMNVKTINAISGPTEAEQQAAIKWLRNAAVSALNESESAIQAKNALRVLQFYDGIIEGDKSLFMMKHPGSIEAKLEHIVCAHYHEVCVATEKPDANLHNNLSELIKEFGSEAVEAAVDAREDDLRTDEQEFYLSEALLFVEERISDVECENA
jgi:hypothetical protein